jgi:hypothetical protein
MEGAAASSVVSFAVLFVFMAAYSQRIYPVPYQWRRVATALAVGAALAVAGKAVDVPLAGAIALALAYPLVLLPLGFYLPAERARLRALVRA